MRLLKFRAWDGTRLHYWGFIDDGFHGPSSTPPHNPMTMVQMQFTGLLDRNSKEIYEGDVVRLTIEPTPHNRQFFDITKNVKKTALIRWDSENACSDTQFEPKATMHPIYEHLRLADADVEILGNLYEHPHLLDALRR